MSGKVEKTTATVPRNCQLCTKNSKIGFTFPIDSRHIIFTGVTSHTEHKSTLFQSRALLLPSIVSTICSMRWNQRKKAASIFQVHGYCVKASSLWPTIAIVDETIWYIDLNVCIDDECEWYYDIWRQLTTTIMCLMQFLNFCLTPQRKLTALICQWTVIAANHWWISFWENLCFFTLNRAVNK